MDAESAHTSRLAFERNDETPVTVYVGDCRMVIRDGIDEGWLPQFDLIFADPPFNVGAAYWGYDDCKTADEYAQFTQEWLGWLVLLLEDRGNLWLNVPDELASLVDQYATGTLKLIRADWVIWHYRFGECTRSRFIRSHVHALHYVLSPDHIWNPDDVLVASDRASKYKDPRTATSQTPGKRVPLDVWYGPGFSRIQGNNRERRRWHPNQLPEAYLERVIRSSSNPGSYVLDPFVGSGTTLAVARALGRPSVGIDISTMYARSAFNRALAGAVRIPSA